MLYKAAAIKEPGKEEALYTNKCKLVEFSAYEKCRPTKIFCVSTDMLVPPFLCLKLGLTGIFLDDANWFTLCNPLLLGRFFLAQPEVIA